MSLAGAVRVHVQIVECAAAVTLSAPYRLSVPDGAAHPALRFPRVINEQQHVVHGLTATFSEPDTNPETTLVYMDSTKVPSLHSLQDPGPKPEHPPTNPAPAPITPCSIFC